LTIHTGGAARTTDVSEIRIGVSACLLGEQVRYDGGHKRNAFLLEDLARYVRFVPLCPEVGIGLGVPREPIRLVREDDAVFLRGASGADHTAALQRWAAAAIRGLRVQDVSGFVLKKGSPSCGLERVKVWDAAAERPTPDGRGLFAQALADGLPGLAMEEDGRLNDAGIREHFVDRVFGHARVRDFFAGPWDAAALVRFHAAEKMAVVAHDPERARALGRLVARQRELPRERLEDRYRELHAEALRRRATPGRQANALMHLAGHLKDVADGADRRELREAIEDYRNGLMPVAVPLALLARHLRAAGAEWARAQTYLEPYPKQLGLRGIIPRRRSRSRSA
jgi:uncharacterized protein YbbK (DUF523 family)/uncharacterized protein YbgA (DUF1722 family)